MSTIAGNLRASQRIPRRHHDPPQLPGPAATSQNEDGHPHHRTILAIDIEGSTNHTNPAKVRLRHAMYELLEQALRSAALEEHDHDPLIDRGDGVLTLVHPVDRAPKTLILNTVIPQLSARLTDHNNRRPSDRFRLRAVLHAGEIHYDRQGCSGEALDLAFRLLDAPETKNALRTATAPLVLVTSDEIYRSIVRHGYRGIDDQAFKPEVHLHLAGRAHQGWIQIPHLFATTSFSTVTVLKNFRSDANDMRSSA